MTALYEIRLNVEPEYKEAILNLYKFLVVIVVFHILMSYTYNGSKPLLFGLTRELFNDDVMNLIFIGMMSIVAYYFIAEKILKFT